MTKKFSLKRTAAIVLAAASLTVFGAGAASANAGLQNNPGFTKTYMQTPVSGTNFAVYVPSGYLAFINTPSYAPENEIGQLYTGDLVTFYEASGNERYWIVYSPKYDKVGFVNKNYLVR